MSSNWERKYQEWCGKFDDLIFKFKNIRESNKDQTESCRFLQAKHKQNKEKEKIRATHILVMSFKAAKDVSMTE